MSRDKDIHAIHPLLHHGNLDLLSVFVLNNWTNKAEEGRWGNNPALLFKKVGCRLGVHVCQSFSICAGFLVAENNSRCCEWHLLKSF